MENETEKEDPRNRIVLIDFWAPWCGPCRMQGNVLDKFRDEIEKNANIVKVNVDESKDDAARWNVMNIPTLVITADGKEMKRFSGLTRPADILKAIEDVVNQI